MMRRLDSGLSTVAGLLLLGLVDRVAAVDIIRPRSLDFIEARGGITVGVPEQANGGWRLPLGCDLSGVSSVNERGNVLHSGLAWWRSAAVIENQRIYLTIETNVQGMRASSARCGPAELGYIGQGVYELHYRNPDGSTAKLGDVTITP